MEILVASQVGASSADASLVASSSFGIVSPIDMERESSDGGACALMVPRECETEESLPKLGSDGRSSDHEMEKTPATSDLSHEAF